MLEPRLSTKQGSMDKRAIPSIWRISGWKPDQKHMAFRLLSGTESTLSRKMNDAKDHHRNCRIAGQELGVSKSFLHLGGRKLEKEHVKIHGLCCTKRRLLDR